MYLSWPGGALFEPKTVLKTIKNIEILCKIVICSYLLNTYTCNLKNLCIFVCIVKK